ncbi:MAG: hypothetical protein QW063_00480 [Candidatus Nanoarchaeia archaeon]
MQSRKAISDLVLMIGLIICAAMLLIGGATITTNLINERARQTPQFLATELVSILNVVQAAPEQVTFNYFTEQDDEGYPVIGSLEIDDDTNELCVSPKTEDEMFGSITEQASIAAGFGAIGYSSARIRSAIASKADRVALELAQNYEKKFADILPTSKEGNLLIADAGKDGEALKKALLSKPENFEAELAQMDFFMGSPETNWIKAKTNNAAGRMQLKRLYSAVDNIDEFSKIAGKSGFRGDINELQRSIKWLSKGGGKDLGERLISKDATLLRNFLKNPNAKTELKALYLGRLTNKEFKILLQQTTKQPLLKRLAAKIPFTQAHKAAKEAMKFRAVSTIKAGKFTKAKLIGGKISTGVLAGSVIGVAMLTGDWEQAAYQSAYTTIVFGRSYIAEFIVNRLAKRAPAQLATESFSESFEWLEGSASTSAPPVPGADVAAGMPFRLINFGLVLADSIVNTALLDNFILQIRDAAGNQVSRERANIVCKNFDRPKANGELHKVLLTPPNCVPTIKYGPTVEDVKEPFKALEEQAVLLAGTSAIISAACPLPNKACGISKLSRLGIITPQVTLIAANLGINYNKYAAAFTHPQDFFPQPTCNSCDKTYLRQDCPNWYISDPGGMTQVVGGSFIVAATTGPLCAGLSWFGGIGSACNLIRYISIGSALIGGPQHVLNFILQGYNVGFQKTSIGSKEALGLSGEFADNTGYWYAELPFAIEISKPYTNNSEINERANNLIIRKV